jgi:hypothetical protein
VIDTAVGQDHSATADVHNFMNLTGPRNQPGIIPENPQLQIRKPWVVGKKSVAWMNNPTAGQPKVSDQVHTCQAVECVSFPHSSETFIIIDAQHIFSGTV